MMTDVLESMLALVALGAFVMSLYSLAQAILDRQALLLQRRNGVRGLIVASRVLRHVARMIKATMSLVAAAWCLRLPPDLDPVSLILKWSLLGIMVVLLVDVTFEQVARQQIDLLLDEHNL
jgi:hypothetical protein